MTIYITGGSNAALRGGWTDAFVTRVVRRHAVRNLALGATNSVMAYTRVLDEVDARPDDVVIWSNATNDALCQMRGYYGEGDLLPFVEALIRHCAENRLRFIPVLLDTHDKLIAQQQPEYREQLHRLFARYGLNWVDVSKCFEWETGQSTMPRRFFVDVYHLRPGGELNDFVADLVCDAVDSGLGVPATVPPVHPSAAASYEVLNQLDVPDAVDRFSNALVDIAVWNPPLDLDPAKDGTTCELVALTVLADPEGGAFDMTVGGRTVTFSAAHWFGNMDRPMALTVFPRNLDPEGVIIAPGQSLRFDWANHDGPIRNDMYFRPDLPPRERGPSRARIVNALVRRPGPARAA